MWGIIKYKLSLFVLDPQRSVHNAGAPDAIRAAGLFLSPGGATQPHNSTGSIPCARPERRLQELAAPSTPILRRRQRFTFVGARQSRGHAKSLLEHDAQAQSWHQQLQTFQGKNFF